MSHVEIDPDWIEQQVLQNPALTEALEAGARRLAPIVKAVAIKDGDQRYADSVRITQGVRPGETVLVPSGMSMQQIMEQMRAARMGK